MIDLAAIESAQTLSELEPLLPDSYTDIYQGLVLMNAGSFELIHPLVVRDMQDQKAKESLQGITYTKSQIDAKIRSQQELIAL